MDFKYFRASRNNQHRQRRRFQLRDSIVCEEGNGEGIIS